MDDRHFSGRVLAVAGTDPTCGAGLSLDVRMIRHLGGIPLGAVTAVTVQDTASVFQVHPLPGILVARQMEAVLDDLGADCIKLGMLATADVVRAVIGVIERHPRIPVVADPVVAGTGGGILLDAEGLELWRRRLIPLVTLVTPNLPEAHMLAGLPWHPLMPVASVAFLASSLASLGCSVLVKGGHGQGDRITDHLYHQGRVLEYRHPRLEGPSFHGTGCALASAIATFLAFSTPLEMAVEKGVATLLKAMENGSGMGRGQRVLGI
ncbi:MAG: hydroxymethylpyrimidine/phosphomethylpyrimidine kinase [Magnetococcales bacterium]|nr:hydroxymethylpyrimidine/phosphomethylpyrimidine kinase [Magnetococcales bacterium]